MEQCDICNELNMQHMLFNSADVRDPICGFRCEPYAAYQNMLAQRREPVLNPLVVYQGEPGAYSEMAARNFFGNSVKATGLAQFEDTFLALKNGAADYTVLPVENSCTGAIRQVYDLLEQYSFFAIGETTVSVNHALMALKGNRLENITTVYSHEQGLLQCQRFLSSYPQWQQVPQADTAGSARMVAELGNPHIAAICSTLAAEIYGLEVLQEKVNTDSNNTTRFFILSSKPELREKCDKVCISFTSAYNPGALQQVISVLNIHNTKLLHLESRPLPGSIWAYMYFLELAGDLMNPDTDSAIRELCEHSPDLRVLGNFQSAL